MILSKVRPDIRLRTLRSQIMPFYGRIGLVMGLRKPLRINSKNLCSWLPIQRCNCFGVGASNPEDSRLQLEDLRKRDLVIRCMLNVRRLGPFDIKSFKISIPRLYSCLICQGVHCLSFLLVEFIVT